MSKRHIEYNWDDTGRLSIDVFGQHLATLRYSPSEVAIAHALFALETPKFKGQIERVREDHQDVKVTTYNVSFDSVRDLVLSNDFGVNYNSNYTPSEGRLCPLTEKDFAAVSRYIQENMMTGNLAQVSEGYKAAANILKSEERHRDEIKALILAFYLDLSGCCGAPHIDLSVAIKSIQAVESLCLTEEELSSMYFAIVRDDITPFHTMSVTESFDIFKLCLASEFEEAKKNVEW